MPRSPATTTSRCSISAARSRGCSSRFCSFTTYALSHNIGGSVLSGAVIRYRAYGTRGLSGQDVGVLVAICWFTFVLSSLLVGGLVLLFEPEIFDRFSGAAAPRAGDRRRPCLADPRRRLRLRQLAASEAAEDRQLSAALSGAADRGAAIADRADRAFGGRGDHLFRPARAGNPGYLVVLGIFLVSFSVAQISHAPGGLGVFEFVFLAGLSDMDQVARAGRAAGVPPVLPDHPADDSALCGAGLRALAIQPARELRLARGNS